MQSRVSTYAVFITPGLLLMFSKVMTDGKSARELFQELSPDALASLVDYYKDDFAIGGYNHSIF